MNFHEHPQSRGQTERKAIELVGLLFEGAYKIRSPLGLGFFSAFFIFQLHVYDSLYSLALAFLRSLMG